MSLWVILFQILDYGDSDLQQQTL